MKPRYCSFRMPYEGLGDDFRPLVTLSPALDQARVRVNDPIFGHRALIVRPFLDAVVPATRW